MNKINSLPVLLILFLHQVRAEDCALSSNKCECIYSDGSGYDLSKITKSVDFFEAQTNESLSFYFHPCGDTKSLPYFSGNVTNDCKDGYSLCMYSINKTGNETSGHASVIGKIDGMDFKGNQLMFPHPQTNKIAVVTLQCTPDTDDTVLYAPLIIDRDQVHLTLFSKAGCLLQIVKPRGFFLTLFIILLTIFFAYLFFGILVNYFLVGARGYELIPNYDFWSKVWQTAKLFFLFVKNGCRVIPTDDSYDAI